MSFERSEQKRMNGAVEAWNQRWLDSGMFLEQFPNPADMPNQVYSQNKLKVYKA